MRFEQAKALLEAFDDEGVQSVLVGSMAMAAQGLVRATRDIDFFISPDDENVDRVKRAFRRVYGDDPTIDEIDGRDLRGEHPVVRYGPPHADYVIDLIARIGEMLVYDDIEHEALDVDGTRVRVATPRMLYRMKRDTARPQDRVDADALRDRFSLGTDDG